jgi:enoyl-CoA hydratase/carnithine racemase
VSAFRGEALSWAVTDGVAEVVLHRPPANEIGTVMLADLERLADALPGLAGTAHALVLRGEGEAGFSAGADLRELWAGLRERSVEAGVAGVREFLERIHRVLAALDSFPRPTIAAVHGVVFGGGLELALACDLIVADRMARFCFPELRLGLVPGFGGVPRLKRDLGNAVVRDLLLTGRSLNAARAHAVGLISQLAAEGRSVDAARALATQLGKFDPEASARAKRFVKPIPTEELAAEIDLFCELLARPAAREGLRRFVENETPMPYLP